jgi:hypothetical protein
VTVANGAGTTEPARASPARAAFCHVQPSDDGEPLRTPGCRATVTSKGLRDGLAGEEGVQ